MLWMWSVLWRENGHFTEVLTLMYICIFYSILWSIGGALFLVYSNILPLNLLIFLFLFINVFPPHSKLFPYRRAGGLYVCKNRARCQSREGEWTF